MHRLRKLQCKVESDKLMVEKVKLSREDSLQSEEAS